MESDPFMPWFIAMGALVAANLILTEATCRRLKKVSPAGWMNAGALSPVNNTEEASAGFMRFVYRREDYGDVVLRRLKWSLRICHVAGVAVFANLLVNIYNGVL